MAGALVALALAVPSNAQGKGGGKKPGKGPARPPSATVVSTPTTAGTSASTSTSGSVELGGAVVLPTITPFAWIDDASVIAPGSVWVAVSMMRWHGSGMSETIVPVVDGAIGLTPRVQVAASVPRVAGGLGTTFFSAKIAVLDGDTRVFKVAVAPTLEILDGASMSAAPSGEGRARWGLPVSAQFDRAGSRIYASSGYFSPGIWYAGAGIGRAVGDRLGVSMSFSHAWATSSASSLEVRSLAGPRRSEISGGASYDLKPNIAVFGSMGRSIGIAAEDGAGTTLGFGLSLNAPSVFTK